MALVILSEFLGRFVSYNIRGRFRPIGSSLSASTRLSCVKGARRISLIRRLLSGMHHGRWLVSGLLCASITLGLSACSSRSNKEPPRTTVFDELTDADLRPKGPQYKGERRYYPGTDSTWPDGSGQDFQNYPGNNEVTARLPKGKGVRSVGDRYELNFANASLPELTKIILKDTLGIPYVYDARVQGRVTISTGRPVSRDELLATLESVLRMNRGVLVQEGSLYSIIPISVAKTGGGAVSYTEEARQIGPGYGITIFPLRYISSETMMKMLSAFVAKPGTLRAEARNNLLLIRGTGRERQTLMQIVQQFDADWIRGQSVGIYSLKHASPDEVIRELEQIFQTEIGGLGKNIIRFRPMERLKAVLVITPRSKLLKKAENWVRRLDRTNDATIRTFVYQVENGKAKDMARLLRRTFAGQSAARRSAADEVSPDLNTTQIVDDAGTNEDAQIQQDEQPDELITGSTATAGRPVRIVADKTRNKLIITSSGRTYKNILRVLTDLDRAPVQVLINATLAEVTLNDNLRYGVQAFLKKNAGNNQKILGFTNAESLVIAPSFPGLNFLAGLELAGLETSPQVVIDLLASETNVRIVSSPSVVVVNNKQAILQVGDEVPIATRAARSVTDPEAPIVNDISFRDTGVILKVIPRVNSSGLVTMEIEQEISNVSNSVPLGEAGTLTPTISKRRIASTIAVYSGQMVVLAGLIQERKDNFKNRVPIWEKVPFFGKFPGKTDNSSVRTELVVFLRPTVIYNPVQASRIAEELRWRLKSMTPNRKTKYERWPKREKRGWTTSTSKP